MLLVYILLIIPFSIVDSHNIYINKTEIDQNKGAELDDLKTQLNTLSKELDLLKLDIPKLENKVADVEIKCDKEIERLNQKYQELFINAEENQKLMATILNKIQYEEQLHSKLEDELRRVSEVLELYEHQYQVVISDLKLMEFRKENGTSMWCTELSHALATEDEDSLMIRAHLNSPYKVRQTKSQQDLEIMTEKRKLKIKMLLKNTFSAKIDTLKKSYTTQLELCKGKKNNINQLINDSFIAYKASEDSVKLFSEDLKAAVNLSKALQVDIEIGKELLKNIKEKIFIMKNKMKDYKSDYKCFGKIMKLD